MEEKGDKFGIFTYNFYSFYCWKLMCHRPSATCLALWTISMKTVGTTWSRSTLPPQQNGTSHVPSSKQQLHNIHPSWDYYIQLGPHEQTLRQDVWHWRRLRTKANEQALQPTSEADTELYKRNTFCLYMIIICGGNGIYSSY